MALDTSKIIHAPVGGGRYTVTSPIVKEDYGLYLKIEGLELPSTYEVDFSNSEHNGTSVTMIGNADGVLIPRQFITTGKDVFAFLYHVGADYGRTVYKFRIPNKLRPDRTDEQPAPEQQSVIDQAISALNSAVEQTAQDVIDADASAQSASDDADRAEQAKNDASTFAQRSAQSAQASADYSESAQASASASANSASQSAQIKDDVESMVDDAQGYASASAQSASASANSASQASASATSASQSASSASGYATSAQSSAQTASAKASEASTSASTASAKATEASQSASLALGYKNDALQAKTDAETAQASAEQAQTGAETAQGLAEDARDEAQTLVDSITGKVEQIDSNTERIESLENDRYKPYVTDTASGAVASFTDGADDLPLKSLVVDINPIQDLHGQDAPYPAGGGKNKFDPSVYSEYVQSDGKYRARGSQINPIQIPIPSTLLNTACTFSMYADMTNAGTLTNVLVQAVVGGSNKNGNIISNGTTGRSVVTFTPTSTDDYIHITFGSNGVNEFTFYDIQLEVSSSVTDYAPYENICPISGWTEVDVEQSGVNVWDEEWEVGTLDATGNPSPHNSVIRSKNYTPVVAGETYYFKVGTTWGLVYVYDKNKSYIRQIGTDSSSDNPYTMPSNAGFVKFRTSTAYGTTYNHDISINYPATDHNYHPYTGRSITIDLGQTVYGGKLDVLSGELTIDRAMVDLGTLDWNYFNQYDCFYSRGVSGIINHAPFISSIYSNAVSSGLSGLANGEALLNNNAVYVKDTRFTDATAFKSAVTGQTLIYELATPIEIQLSANQINSLYGTNNIFADTGDTSCEYRADTTLYISRLTEPDSDMIADANITSGKYFMVGNTLYKATANIASGASVIVGTNAIRKSLSEALNEINV